LALSGSILLASLWLGIVFRYDTQVWGNSVLVHDRWFGTLERCAGGGKSSICVPLLGAGMQPLQSLALSTTTVSPPKPARVWVPHKMSDEEFKALMDSVGEPPPQGSQ
jgi:hypothetical protein